MSGLIERIKKHVKEDGECWAWGGATLARAPTPVIRYDGKVMSVRRAIALEQGKQVKGKIVTTTCRNPVCVNPEHVRVTNRAALQALVLKETGYHTTIEYRLAVSKGWAKSRKLSDEDVLAIRASDDSSRDLAERFGVSQWHINAVRRGEARPLVGRSVWGGLMR